MIVLIRGGGDLASGVALRLHRCGAKVIITELEQPLVVRRSVAFAEAVYSGAAQVENTRALRVANALSALEVVSEGNIAVLVDPMGESVHFIRPEVLVDARLLKQPPEVNFPSVPLQIGLGPGFIAGENCSAVVETMRGPYLGRVYWQGTAEVDTGIPEAVLQHQGDRVLRSPGDGVLETVAEIGDVLQAGELIARIGETAVIAPFKGLLRGLMHDGLRVETGLKIGDMDPRLNPDLCKLVSDKALAVGGGVLEIMLTTGRCPDRRNS